MPKSRRLFALASGLLLSLATTIAGAAEVSFPALEDNVPGHPDITYVDLARQIVPDLAKVAGGWT